MVKASAGGGRRGASGTELEVYAALQTALEIFRELILEKQSLLHAMGR